MLTALARARRRSSTAIARAEAARARADTRDWAVERRARTRQLIELGGLVQKAGLVELTEDDRATMLGAFLELAAALRGMGDDAPEHLRARWRRRGLRAFDADREASEESGGQERDGRSRDTPAP
jgi:hypothetical protein